MTTLALILTIFLAAGAPAKASPVEERIRVRIADRTFLVRPDGTGRTDGPAAVDNAPRALPGGKGTIAWRAGGAVPHGRRECR